MHAFQGDSPEAELPNSIVKGELNDFIEGPTVLGLGLLTDIRVSPLGLDWLRLP